MSQDLSVNCDIWISRYDKELLRQDLMEIQRAQGIRIVKRLQDTLMNTIFRLHVDPALSKHFHDVDCQTIPAQQRIKLRFPNAEKGSLCFLMVQEYQRVMTEYGIFEDYLMTLRGIVGEPRMPKPDLLKERTRKKGKTQALWEAQTWKKVISLLMLAYYSNQKLTTFRDIYNAVFPNSPLLFNKPGRKSKAEGTNKVDSQEDQFEELEEEPQAAAQSDQSCPFCPSQPAFDNLNNLECPQCYDQMIERMEDKLDRVTDVCLECLQEVQGAKVETTLEKNEQCRQCELEGPSELIFQRESGETSCKIDAQLVVFDEFNEFNQKQTLTNNKRRKSEGLSIFGSKEQEDEKVEETRKKIKMEEGCQAENIRLEDKESLTHSCSTKPYCLIVQALNCGKDAQTLSQLQPLSFWSKQACFIDEKSNEASNPQLFPQINQTVRLKNQCDHHHHQFSATLPFQDVSTTVAHNPGVEDPSKESSTNGCLCCDDVNSLQNFADLSNKKTQSSCIHKSSGFQLAKNQLKLNSELTARISQLEAIILSQKQELQLNSIAFFHIKQENCIFRTYFETQTASQDKVLSILGKHSDNLIGKSAIPIWSCPTGGAINLSHQSSLNNYVFDHQRM